MFKKIVLVATVLALCVVVLGAYVRLSDAGLGCPDWPGCYGHITVPHTSDAVTAFPDKPLETHKAWKEMAHRYFAGTLGLLILAVFVTAWRNRRVASPALPSALLILVIFQAALGMWTVTLLLKPVIVSLHLIGGMTTLGLLTWLASRRSATVSHPAIRPWALLALLVLACQIILGGWTSTNYAALACPDFPACQGMLLPPTDFANAFHLVRELGVNADGSQLSLASLTAIHLMHRLGALITFLYLGWFGSKLLKIPGLSFLGKVLLTALLAQVALGISNVVFSLPLAVAVGHNAGAAILLMVLVVINSNLTPKDK